MRLFPPVVHIAKGTSPTTPSPIELTHPSTNQTYSLPANTTIYINCVALQSDPEIYGADAPAFRPDRFIESPPAVENRSSGAKPKQESIRTYGRGTYLAWSAGPRVCPGSKMSQVEFVAVFMTVFRRCRVEVVKREVDVDVVGGDVGRGREVEGSSKRDGKEKGGRRLETVDEARRRVEGVMADSQSRLTLQMNRPREVEIRFVKR
jgi:Cytochrome P450